ncbi:MAG TPA: DUF1259 domain-containing protein [Gemmatimonadales bacterium]|nr:DUF1259 domain-containing protein [Gemmatimonadales bacterium]
MRVLAERGMNATAVHGHLVGERARLAYIHFWAEDPRARVLRAIREVAVVAQR